MNNILKAWNAGFVRRWHTQPRLVDSDDRDSGHQHRCTILLLLLWPDSTRDAIIDSLVHDQGETDSGDLAQPAKVQYPEIAALLAEVEKRSIADQGFTYGPLSDVQKARRQFVDSLDSYLWMLRHAPSLRHRPEWVKQEHGLCSTALELDVMGEYNQLIISAEQYYI